MVSSQPGRQPGPRRMLSKHPRTHLVLDHRRPVAQALDDVVHQARDVLAGGRQLVHLLHHVHCRRGGAQEGSGLAGSAGMPVAKLDGAIDGGSLAGCVCLPGVASSLVEVASSTLR